MAPVQPALRSYLHQYIPEIEREMFSFLPVREPEGFLYGPMRDYPERGGKRFRPALVLLACEALGGDAAKAMRTAAAFEMFQSFAVVHDDIEDDSDFRRGKPCIHKLHGIPLSVNVGDALYSKVFEMLCANQEIFSSGMVLELIQEMVRGSRETFEGQAFDVGWIRQRHIPTEVEFMVMLRKKTGWYTGRGPCIAGAIIADADADMRATIAHFGEEMAVAFQIRDDLLNLTTHAKDADIAPGVMSGAYGKERGGDIAEGKRTLIIIDLLRKCSDSESIEVLEILHRDRESISSDEIEHVIDLVERYGCTVYADEVCQRIAKVSLEYLEKLPPTPARDIMGEMLEFLIRRAF